MKRKLILICTLVLLMSLCLTTAMADGRPTPPPKTTPLPTYDHVDVRVDGSMQLTLDGVMNSYPLTVTRVQVFVDQSELTMSGPVKSESKLYPLEFQSDRKLSIAAGAVITVSCDFSYQVSAEDVRTGSGNFIFTAEQTNCESQKKGIDVTIVAERSETTITPSPTPSPTPEVTPAPPAAQDPTPTPVLTPTPTPTLVPGTNAPPSNTLPQTGEVSDMWLIIMVLTGLCAITGAVLLILRRADRR